MDWDNNGSSHSVVLCGLDERGWGGGLEYRGAEISTEIATIWRPRERNIKVAEWSKKNTTTNKMNDTSIQKMTMVYEEDKNRIA